MIRQAILLKKPLQFHSAQKNNPVLKNLTLLKAPCLLELQYQFGLVINKNILYQNNSILHRFRKNTIKTTTSALA